jgi:hypothetical protein
VRSTVVARLSKGRRTSPFVKSVSRNSSSTGRAYTARQPGGVLDGDGWRKPELDVVKTGPSNVGVGPR